MHWLHESRPFDLICSHVQLPRTELSCFNRQEQLLSAVLQLFFSGFAILYFTLKCRAGFVLRFAEKDDNRSKD